MFRRERDTGKIIGVLSDFDLSSLEGDTHRNSERTGTFPFMARELLTTAGLKGRIKHQYKHDAEAFFWVAVIDTALYPSTKHKKTDENADKNTNENTDENIDENIDYVRDLLRWATGKLSPYDLLQHKQAWMTSPENHVPTKEQKECWDGFREVASIWSNRMIQEMCNNPPSDDPSLLHGLHVAARESYQAKSANEASSTSYPNNLAD